MSDKKRVLITGITGQEKRCQLCSTPFLPNPKTSPNKRKKQIFCSGFCAKRYNGLHNRGLKRSSKFKEAHRKQFSGKNNPFYGRTHNKKTRLKISLANTGKKRTQEFKTSLAARVSGCKNPFWGKKHTKQALLKMSRLGRQHKNETKILFSQQRRLEKNPAWRGGISYENYSLQFSPRLKAFIRERDHFSCKVCAKYGSIVHHIDYNKQNSNPENLITLCNSCHGKTGFNRVYWKNTLTKLIQEKEISCQRA
jgi:hypothetical protein